MTYQEVAEMISSMTGTGTGINDAAYYAFPEEEAPAPPFITYYYPSQLGFEADNSIYTTVEELVIELYTETKDITTEQKVTSVLNAYGLVYDRTEAWIGSERLLQNTFTTSVLITDPDEEEEEE